MMSGFNNDDEVNDLSIILNDVSINTTNDSIITTTISNTATNDDNNNDKHLINVNLESILQYLSYNELLICTNVCKYWYDILVSNNDTSRSFLWTPSYVQLVLPTENNIERCSSLLFNKLSRFDWRKKVKEVANFIGSRVPIVIEEVLKRNNNEEDNSSKLRLASRSGHSANTLIYSSSSSSTTKNDEIIVLFGGASHFFRFLNSFDIFRVEDGKIIASGLHAQGDIPSPRWLHSSVLVPNNASINCHILNDYHDTSNILIFGGQSDHQVEDDIFMFNLRHNAENKLLNIDSMRLIAEGDKPCARAGHSLLLSNSSNPTSHKYILFGGSSNTVCLNDVYMLDVTCKSQNIEYFECPYHLKWTKLQCTGQTPLERWCHSAVMRENDYIVFGGWNYIRLQVQNQVFCNDIHILNTETLSWTQLITTGPPPMPRSQAPLFYIPSIMQNNDSKGYLLMFGGACHNNDLDANVDHPYGSVVIDLHDFKVFDLDTYTWLPITYTYPRFRGGVNAVVECSRGLLMSGGMHSDHGMSQPRFINDVVVMRPVLGIYSKTKVEDTNNDFDSISKTIRFYHSKCN